MRMISGPQGPRVLLDGRPVLLLGSDNYLGLADHPRVREAAADAAMRYGAGAGASRLTSGTMRIHRRLEERLGDFLGEESTLLFGSRYLANVGVVPALAGPGELILCDAHAHPSIHDGAALSRGEVGLYRHNDMEHLDWMLSEAGGRASLIATDAVFGTDGDAAPLEALVELAHRHDARLLVDDSHGVGTAGPEGQGAVASAGLTGQVDVLVGSLGKALGSYGGFVCCDGRLAGYLAGTARTLTDSTALPPPAVAAAMAALVLLREEPRRVEKLARNASVLRDALEHEDLHALGSAAPVASIAVSGDRAEDAAERALGAGVFTQAADAPGATAGSRLRLSVMATHTKAELRDAARAVARATPPDIRGHATLELASSPGHTAGTGVFDGLAEAA